MIKPVCQNCKKEIERKTYGKYLESLEKYQGRKFCTRSCFFEFQKQNRTGWFGSMSSYWANKNE